ncbi:hypothetical protein [Thioclava sp. GXIMD4216]|uniref:Nickel/cobalt transporter regulator n=1 Tax=Thioclava litoralis TaxID=3076557 RepID=A0ABZ1DZC2_9RHOB|nr:hypothetical protein RPE78_00575 [Thioclava sp. FTW29]
MKRLLMSASIALVTLSGAAFADQGHNTNGCAPGQKCQASQSQKSDNHGKAVSAQASSKKAAPQQQVSAKHSAPGRAPSAAQLKRLPAPPKGQEYRIVNERVVRVDTDTLKTVAVIGLVSALLSNK